MLLTSRPSKKPQEKTSNTGRPPRLASDGGKSPGTQDLARELRRLLEDVFRQYVKAKDLHWLLNHTKIEECALLLDEHAEQLSLLVQEVNDQLKEVLSIRADLSISTEITKADHR